MPHSLVLRGSRLPIERAKDERHPLVAVVGPCASGKTALTSALRERDYNAREVVQEHSLVPTMWRQITDPDVLIYLHVSWEVACWRRRMDTTKDRWSKLVQRLLHARQHADIYIDTDRLTRSEVLSAALRLLQRHEASTT